MTPLVQAIDEAVAFVRARPEQMSRAEVEQLRELADNVYILARSADLLDALPQTATLREDVDRPELPSPAHFETKLNWPGDWGQLPDDGDGEPLMLPKYQDDPGDWQTIPEKVFLTCDPPRWFEDMATLRKLADGLPRDTNQDPSASMLANETKVKAEDVPPAYRENEEPDGKILTAPYLHENPDWDLAPSYLTKNYGPGKPLTNRIKVGRAKAYLYRELAALRRTKTDRQSRAE